MKQGTVSASDLKLNPLNTDKIVEHVKHSWYEDSSTGKHPKEGMTKPLLGKVGAYSWAKAPRYDGQVYEVGPLARVVATYVGGDAAVKQMVDSVLAKFNASPKALFSVLGRHAARALYCKFVADAMPGWLLQLKPGEPAYVAYEIPDESQGMGLVDGARGALGHWVQVKDKKIANYQCVVPSTWNFGPRDDKGQPGPVEQALIGTKIKDEKNPFEIARIVRSMDPCLACAIHVIAPKGREIGRFKVC